MKEKLKKVYEFLKKPKLWFTVLCYLLFVCFGILAIVFACQNKMGFGMYFAYSGMAVTFFYCVYLFIRYDFKAIKNWIKTTKQKLEQKSKIFNGYFNDNYSRTMINTILSFIMGICFVIYNALVGLIYHSVWNGSIAIYYLLLVGVRLLILVSEYKLANNKDKIEDEKQLKRAKIFYIEGVLLLVVCLALIAPVTILALSKKQVNLPMWVAIADATYVFYKIGICIYSAIKTRNNQVLAVNGIKNLNLTAVAVTLLSLENTMILTFSETVDSSMKIITILTALAVMAINMWIAIITIIKGKKEVKLLETQQ